MDIGTLLTAAIAVIAVLGGAVGYYGKSRGDSIIKYQAIEITDRDGRITYLEKALASLQAENKTLKVQNDKLAELAQGAPELKTLTKAIETLTQATTLRLK